MLRVARILISTTRIASLFNRLVDSLIKVASKEDFGEGATGWFKKWASQSHMLNGQEVFPPIKMSQDGLVSAMAMRAAAPFNSPDESYIRELITDKLLQLDDPSARLLVRNPTEPAKSMYSHIDGYLAQANEKFGIDTQQGIEEFNRIFYGAVLSGIKKYIISVLSAQASGRDVRYKWKADNILNPVDTSTEVYDVDFLSALQESATQYSEAMGQLIHFMENPQKGDFPLKARNQVKKTVADFAKRFLGEHPEYREDLYSYLENWQKNIKEIFMKKQTDPNVKLQMKTQNSANVDAFLKYLQTHGTAYGSKVRNTTTFGNSDLDNHARKLQEQGYNILVEDAPSMEKLTPQQIAGMDKAKTLFRHRKYTLLDKQGHPTLVTAGRMISTSRFLKGF